MLQLLFNLENQCSTEVQSVCAAAEDIAISLGDISSSQVCDFPFKKLFYYYSSFSLVIISNRQNNVSKYTTGGPESGRQEHDDDKPDHSHHCVRLRVQHH